MKTYKVTGTVPVLGTPPGEEFEEQLDPKHEARLIASGSVEVVPKQRVTKAKLTDEKRGPLFGHSDKEVSENG